MIICSLEVGGRAIVSVIDDLVAGAEDVRRLGIREGAFIEVIQKGSLLLLQIEGSRVAFEAGMLDCVQVQPI